ncbi:MAG: hypothetical protein Q9202_001043 [Teloschistes flavicans]
MDDLHLPFDRLPGPNKSTALAQLPTLKNIGLSSAGDINNPAQTRFNVKPNSWARPRSDDDECMDLRNPRAGPNRDTPSLSVKHPVCTRRSLDISFGAPKNIPSRDSQRASTRANLRGAGFLDTSRCVQGDEVPRKQFGPSTTRNRLNRVSTQAKRQHVLPAKREEWQIQKDVLSTKFGPTGWSPRKRLSPDALEGIRALHAHFPEKYSTPVLADQFEVSPEAIRRILKSKWRPNEDEVADRRQRWDIRGERIWTQMVALGVKPPKKWRDVSVRVYPFLQDFMIIRGAIYSSALLNVD